MARMSSSVSSSTFCTSCDERNPSKKWTKGIRAFRVAECAIMAMSITSWTLAEEISPNPVERVLMTSLWSPKIERACAATARADTWNTVGVNSPAILNMLGIMSKRPCEAVKVVVSAPACSEPCTLPAAPPSLCISTTEGTIPQMFLTPFADHSSANSPIGDDGVMG
ncbi:MAG: hypothetical protein BWZ10_00658 [candidate division BRC1 bacterium ADurb.BinA364]|nr:MAG: hypothetical protein BWZ10_00658 [candidate division BRC1 bacterium ADurb.BinA364]